MNRRFSLRLSQQGRETLALLANSLSVSRTDLLELALREFVAPERGFRQRFALTNREQVSFKLSDAAHAVLALQSRTLDLSKTDILETAIRQAAERARERYPDYVR